MTDKPTPDSPAIVPEVEQQPVEVVRTVLVSPEAIPAMGELFLSLERILKAERPANMSAAKAERHRSIRLLQAVSIFIERSWGDPMSVVARRYLLNLSANIEQLNDGVAHPMLRRESRRGRPGDRLDIWNARKLVCAAVECHLRSRKHTREAAATFIAGQQPKLKRLIRDASEDTHGRASRGKLSDAILSWHRQFQQGEANEIAQATWQNMLQLLDDSGVKTPEQWTGLAHNFLRMAHDAAAEIVLTPK
jgi:hypothetical protein